MLAVSDAAYAPAYTLAGSVSWNSGVKSYVPMPLPGEAAMSFSGDTDRGWYEVTAETGGAFPETVVMLDCRTCTFSCPTGIVPPVATKAVD